jgi:F-type H+-transporting ATPase subunit gamma
LVYRPIVRGLLPLKADEVRRSIEELGEVSKNKPFTSAWMGQYIFEPSEEELLAVILPKLAEVVIYQAILESLAAEHSARMIAMKNASENADKLTEDLVVGFNQARQAAITQEIAEVVGGANS